MNFTIAACSIAKRRSRFCKRLICSQSRQLTMNQRGCFCLKRWPAVFRLFNQGAVGLLKSSRQLVAVNWLNLMMRTALPKAFCESNAIRLLANDLDKAVLKECANTTAWREWPIEHLLLMRVS